MKNPSAEYYLFDISIYAYSSLYLVLLHLFNLKPLVLAAAEKAAPSHLDLGVQFLARGQISELIINIFWAAYQLIIGLKLQNNLHFFAARF